MSNGMRSIWKVFVVDPRGAGKVLIDGVSVIAVTETEAQLMAGVGEVIKAAGLDFGQADIYCELIATFIRPRKESQKVVLADKDEKE